ncbi:hypothetical protein Q7P35_005493 [Cladosporium inversicolor]
MGEHTASKVVNVVVRFFQLCSDAIILGIVGWVLHRINIGNGPNNSRLIYVEVLAAMSLVVSIVLLIPFKFVFKAWPLDIILFIMWVVAFGLLADLTGTSTCSGRWYVNYWGWYWSGTASSRACSNWRAVLAFSCINWILFMVSAMLGAYVHLGTQSSDDISGNHHRRKPWQREKHENDATVSNGTGGTTTTQVEGVTGV